MKIKIAVNAASGKMGQQVISQTVNHSQAELTAALCRAKHRLLNRQVAHSKIIYTSDMPLALKSSDVIIDFSRSEVTLDLVKQASKNKTPVLIGTTGFEKEQLAAIKRAAKSIPILLAPNTSIGVNSTLALLAMASKMLGKQADIEIIESHHRHKIDAPSGTALRMGETIAEAMGKKFNKLKVTDSRFEKRSRRKGEIGLSSIRAGEIIGEHKVMFVLDNEEIIIEHKAQNRHCFAEGSVTAAIWLASQSAGFYSMQDFLADS